MGNQLDEELLNKIHAIALSDDHRRVYYDKSREKMLGEMVENLERKLLYIADMLQVLAGD